VGRRFPDAFGEVYFGWGEFQLETEIKTPEPP
jgi:hypothetical protein